MGPTIDRIRATDWPEWATKTGLQAVASGLSLVVVGSGMFTLEIASAVGFAALSTVTVAVLSLLGRLLGSS